MIAELTPQSTSDLTLGDVERLLGFQKQPMGSFASLLSLESLTEQDHQELAQIRDDFDRYLTASKVSEGLVKALTTYPLLKLAGYYRYPIEITLEENIAPIHVEDEDTLITGRMDILAIGHAQTGSPRFWVLVIESKNSGAEVRQGLPQLLTYAYKSLEQQSLVWALATNGIQYLFVNIRRGEAPTYQLMPEFNLTEPDRAAPLLQVLKAICKTQNTTTPISAIA